MFILTSNGLTYLRSRFYNPRLGRFMTPDAIIPDWTSGQNWNQYAYVLNDPLNWIDPSGFEKSPITNSRDFAEALWNETVGRAHHWLKQQGDALRQWWNESPCDCAGPPTNVGFLGGGMAGLLYKGTKLGEDISTLSTQFRTGLGPIPLSRWKTITSVSKPTSEFGQDVLKYGRNWSGPIQKTSVFRQARTALRTRTIPKLGAFGTIGSVFLSGLTDFALKLMEDGSRCIPRKEMARNAIIAGGYGILSASIGGIIGIGVIALFGAPVAAGAALAAGIGFFLDNGTASVLGRETGLPELSPIVHLRNKQLR